MVKVTYCQTIEKPVPGDPSISKCSECENWENGKGNKQCLKCSTYKNFCITSTPRQKIAIEILPAAIMDELADTSDEMPPVLEALKQLPNDLSLIISARYVAGISPLALAGLLHISERNVERRQALGLAVIKKMLRKENIELRKKAVG